MRKHEWKADGDNGHRFDRKCLICEIRDHKIGKSGKWQVETPCIDPVPEKVAYEQLVAEITEAIPNEHRRKELIGRICCIGVPGHWQVGFSTYHSVYPHQSEGFRELEQGFAFVLRFLRARQFDPYKHSDYSYQEKLGKPEYHSFDD